MIVLRLAVLTTFVGLFVAAAPQTADEQVLRTPSIPEWRLLHKVNPGYPAAALRNRIEGTVRLAAVVGKDGRIERLRLISGHPLLRRAARDAAQQRIYRPTLLGGQPVRVFTEIDIQFQLDQYGKPLKEDSRSSEPSAVL